jgi:hypothetical protein
MATIRFNEDELKRIFTAAFEHSHFPCEVAAVRLCPRTPQDGPLEENYVEVTITQRKMLRGPLEEDYAPDIDPDSKARMLRPDQEPR